MQDLTGKTFGRLTVIGLVGSDVRGRLRWLCDCECRNEKVIRGDHLRRDAIKSCGCLNKEHSLKHGHNTRFGRTPTYVTWEAMRHRCYYSKHKNFHRYGGRGITICDHWHEFKNFLADMGEKPPGLSIDRINNDGNYSCGKCEQCLASGWRANCRWATQSEQEANKKPTRVA